MKYTLTPNKKGVLVQNDRAVTPGRSRQSLVGLVAAVLLILSNTLDTRAQYTYSRRPEDYRSVWVTQNANPTLQRGEPYQFSIQFRNTGAATWHRGVVNLGTDRPRDRIPGFVRDDERTRRRSGWISSNRVELQEAPVPPGGIGTFVFWYTVPATHALGVFREYFRPVADGITWMDDCGCYWDVTVIDRPRLPQIPTVPPPGGVRNPFERGQCTYYAAQRWIDWGYGIPALQDAKYWLGKAQENGFPTGRHPRRQSIMVLDAWDGNIRGHVAIVESVSGQTVTVSHMNWLDDRQLREGDQFDIIGNSAVWKLGRRPYPLLGFIHPK